MGLGIVVDRLERLAIRSAVLSPAQAMASWNELTNSVPWMELPDGVQRCLPAIAVNLACHGPRLTPPADEDSVPYAGRLKGVYRASWADNIMRIRHARPLLERLSHSQLNYRVLKGSAICAITDRWGVRRMGDIDIVVAKADFRAAITSLRQEGFEPRFFRRISTARPPESASWEGPEGQIVDLHVAARRSPNRSILDWAIRAPSIPVESQGIRWPVPPPEVMLIHALIHARLGAASSDHAQALLDVEVLLPRVNTRRLLDLASRTRTLGLVHLISAELADVRSDISCESAHSSAHSEHSGRAWKRSLRQDLQRARTLPTVIVERRPNRRDLRRVFHQRGVRRAVYIPWLVIGQLRPVERAAYKVTGGFLLQVGSELHLERELRVRAPVPPRIVGRNAHLVVACSDPRARVLFVNGISTGVVSGFARVFVERIPPSIEVSARFLGDPPPSVEGEASAELRVTFPDCTTT